MHVVDLGLIKYFIELWLGKKPFFTKFKICGEELEELNKCLSWIQSTDNITRNPRTLEELHYWKADEYKTVALYFFPLMEKFLPRVYFNHFKDFVRAYRILCSPEIQISQFEEADFLLKRFCKYSKMLYGPRIFTVKIHQVCYHLLDHVRLFGPPCQFSAKRYEDINGQLMRKNYGKHKIASQLIQKVSIPTTIDLMIEQIGVQQGSFFAKLLGDLGMKDFQEKNQKWVRINEKMEYNVKQKRMLMKNNNLWDLACELFPKKVVYTLDKIRFINSSIKCYTTEKRNSSFVLIQRNAEILFAKLRKFLVVDNTFFVIFEPISLWNNYFYGKIANKEIKTNPLECEKIEAIIDSVVCVSSVVMENTYLVPFGCHEAIRETDVVFDMMDIFKFDKITKERVKELCENENNYNPKPNK